MTIMAYQGFFIDLSEVLTEEQYTFYKPYFHYIDRDLLENGDLAIDKSLPAGTDSSDMKDPIPVFIDISNCDKLSLIYNHDIGSLFFGITPNAPHTEHAVITLDYLVKP